MMWFSLDKKNKPKHQGLIKLRLSFSAEKNTKVAVQEHKHLLRVLLLHELESSKVAPYWWSGKFSDQGEAVITTFRPKWNQCKCPCLGSMVCVHNNPFESCTGLQAIRKPFGKIATIFKLTGNTRRRSKDVLGRC